MRTTTALLVLITLLTVAVDLKAGTKTTWKCRPDGDNRYFIITQINGSGQLYLTYMTGYDVPIWKVPVTMTETGNVQTFSVRYGTLGGQQDRKNSHRHHDCQLGYARLFFQDGRREGLRNPTRGNLF